jgi:hypothetical protein
MKKLLLFVVLALSVTSAVYIDFENARAHGDPSVPYHFGTDVRFESSIDSCRVASCPYGSPDDCLLEGTLCSGTSVVCPGTTIAVTPEAEGRWAAPSLSIYSIYPYCPGDPDCPQPVDYATIHTNRDIYWLSDSVYAKYDVDTGGHATQDLCWPTSTCPPGTWGQTGLDTYYELDTFHTQKMTYRRYEPEGPLTNKRGRANVFCNGDIEVRYAGGPWGTQSIPGEGGTYSEISIPLIGGEGTATLTPAMRNIDCFGSNVVYPAATSNPNWRIYYFGYGMPSLGTQTGTPAYVEIENRQPSLDVVYVSVTEYSSSYIFEIWLINDGDVPVKVSRAYPVGPGHPQPLEPLLCTMYGIPTPPCPSSSGFGQEIGVGHLHVVYVLYGGDLDEDLFELRYITDHKVCSTLTEWSTEITVDPNVHSCRVRPSSHTVDPYEVHEYEVTCYNILDDPVPCNGDTWYWNTLAGSFIERTNEHALAYAYSPGGSTGRLYYQDASGVRCYSDVTISDEPHLPDYYRCELDPPSARLDVGDEQYFDITSYLDDVEVTPDAVDYALTGGVAGSLSDESLSGVRYTATTPSFGLLRAYSQYRVSGDPRLRGAVCVAGLLVEEAGNESDRFQCELIPNSTSLNIGDSQAFELHCYFDGVEVTPDSASYTLIDGLSGTLSGESVSGVTFTGTVNSSGHIQAYAEYTPPGLGLFGTTALAYVQVGERGEGPEEPPDGEGDKNKLCVIIPNDIEKPRYDSGSVTILCGESPPRGTCTPGSVTWEMDPDLGIVLGSHLGAIYTLTGEVGEYGLLIARIDDEIGCWADVKILEPTCLEYT